MILTCIPYSPDGNLGRAYNEFMRRLEPGDWGCFIDHDAMFTTKQWYQQLEQAIATHPDAGVFTGITNRIGNPDQLRTGLPLLGSPHDIRYHRFIGEDLRHRMVARDVTHSERLISGVVLCLSRYTWARIGGFKDGFLGVDNQLHRDIRDAGKRVYILEGLYVYHWYRAELDPTDTALQRQPGPLAVRKPK